MSKTKELAAEFSCAEEEVFHLQTINVSLQQENEALKKTITMLREQLESAINILDPDQAKIAKINPEMMVGSNLPNPFED